MVGRFIYKSFVVYLEPSQLKPRKALVLKKNEMTYETIIKKAEVYKDKNIVVHITLLSKFYNGKIKFIGDDYLMLEERKLGETIVLFCEVKDIDPYKEVGK